MQDVSDDMEMKSPRVNLVIDRDKAAAVGLNATQIENALYDGFGPQWSSTIYGADGAVPVLLELDPKYQEHADSLQKIAFKTPSGALVPLESVRQLQGNRRAADASTTSGSCRRCRSRSACGRASRSAPPSIASTQVARQRAAADGDDELPGLGEGVPGSR